MSGERCGHGVCFSSFLFSSFFHLLLPLSLCSFFEARPSLSFQSLSLHSPHFLPLSAPAFGSHEIQAQDAGYSLRMCVKPVGLRWKDVSWSAAPKLHSSWYPVPCVCREMCMCVREMCVCLMCLALPCCSLLRFLLCDSPLLSPVCRVFSSCSPYFSSSFLTHICAGRKTENW